MSEQTDRVLARLSGVRADGSGWAARCPCRNDDQNPSLHVGEGRDGRVLLTCHRGNPCTLDQICTAMSLTTADLFPPPTTTEKSNKLTLVATYDYFDADGELLFQKVRYRDGDGKKTFRQRRPDGRGGWTYSLGDTPKVLYRLPQITAAIARGDTIYVVEGEKDADAVVAAGHEATTMPGGAGKWLPIHTKALTGAKLVRVIADNDTPGVDHARTVIDTLHNAGVPVVGFRCPHTKDIADHLGEGRPIFDLVPLSLSDDEPVTDLPDHPLVEVADAIASLADDDTLTDAAKLLRARALLDRAVPDRIDLGVVQTWEDLIDEPDQEPDWIIPGLFARGERLICVAPEGLGKTMLARQMAILPAGGLHPFTRQRIPKIRTLMIDLENPKDIIRRKGGSIVRTVRNFTDGPIDAHLLIKPDGLNLLKPDSRVALEETIDDIRPDLLLLGPLYKSYIDPGGRTSEAIATEMIMYFDYIRTTYKCALWLEAHAPLGSSMTSRDLRPFGSAVWSRWPEFSIAMSLDPTANGQWVYDSGTFRGDREPRPWPKVMTRGQVFPFDVLEYRPVD